MRYALQFLALTVAGWLNRHQEDVIDYLQEENRILREQLGCPPCNNSIRAPIAWEPQGDQLGTGIIPARDANGACPPD